MWLLSFDGGGVRGLSTLYILRNIMARLNQARKEMEPPLPAVKPCDVFDLIGGTSTGGIIAIMLGRLEMDVQPCIDTYRKLIKTLFKNKAPFSIDWRGHLKGKFSSKLLKASIDEVVAEMGYSGSDPLNDGVERKCKVFVCARAVETNSTSRLRSYDLPHEPYVGVAPTITEAAMATSAAVSFFDPVEVGSRKYVDAGLGTNNPVDEVEEEACEIWCRKKRVSELQTRTACFVSIGTGHPGNKSINDRVDKFLMQTLRDIATETETTARKSENKWAQQMENETYFRFNVDHGLDDVGLEEYAKEGTIESVTDSHLKIRRIQIDLDNCTKALGSKQCVCDMDFS